MFLPPQVAALLVTLLPLASAEIIYQNAQTPPPSPPKCQGWCPRWTCCKMCDDPACVGCGAKKDCTSEAMLRAGADRALDKDGDGLPDPDTAPYFETGKDGNLYANGVKFTVKGLNWWGTEGHLRVPGGLTVRECDDILSSVVEWGFNSLRILVNHHNILVNGKLPADSYDEGLNPWLIGIRYMDMLSLLFRKAANKRLLVMVNVHRTNVDSWPGDGLWYDKTVSEAEALESWTKLSTLMCQHWNVFAADLVNEPVHASWGRGTSKDWNKAAERIGNKVQATCPRLLIFVQGVGGDPGAPEDGGISEGYFWGENLVGVKSAPVKLNDQSKLVYSPHTYGPGVFAQQPYFPECTTCSDSDKTFPDNMPEIWDRHFGFVKEETKHAIVLGEFGGFYTGDDQKWQDKAVDYFIERGFGAFYFCLNPDSDDTGGLVKKDWYEVEEEKLLLLARLPGTSVKMIVGEEPPSPSPPDPPPVSPPPPPKPLFSKAFLDMLHKPPPPKPPPPSPSPPPPPWFPWTWDAEDDPYKHRAHDGTIFSQIEPESVKTNKAAKAAKKAAAVPKDKTFKLDVYLKSKEGKPAVIAGMCLLAFLLAYRYNHRFAKVANVFFALLLKFIVDLLPLPAGITRKIKAIFPDPNRPPAPKKIIPLPKKPEREGYGKLNAEVEEQEKDDPSALTDEDLEIIRRLTPGAKVVVFGLQGAPQHNGEQGMCMGKAPDDPTGLMQHRFNVRLHSGDLLALRHHNLRVVGAAPDIRNMIEALERAGEHEKAAVLRAYKADAPSNASRSGLSASSLERRL